MLINRLCRMLFVLLVLAPYHLPAQQSKQGSVRSQLLISHNIAAAVHPLGLSWSISMAEKLSLYQRKSGILWDPAHIELGIQNRLTPAFDDVMIYTRIEPIAIFDVHAAAGIRFAYNTFSLGHAELSSYDTELPPSNSVRRADAWGIHWSISPRVKMQLSRFIAAHTTTIAGYNFPQTEEYFLEPVFFTVLKRKDILIEHKTNAIIEIPLASTNILAGLEYRLLSIPADSSNATTSHRIASLAVERIPLHGWTLVIAEIIGLYLNEVPYSYAEPYIAISVTAVFSPVVLRHKNRAEK